MASPFTETGTTILVVDDEPLAAAFVAEVLAREKFVPLICCSGPDALALVKRANVDLVLMDLLMPDMDGFSASQAIKGWAAAEDRFMPIIIISGRNDQDDKIKGLTWADDYVTKPFSEVELLARIRALLRTRRLQDELLRSNRRYRSLYENFPNMYVALDDQRRITDCNAALSSVVGQSGAALNATLFSELFAPDERPLIDYFLASLVKVPGVKQESLFSLTTHRADHEPSLLSVSAVYNGATEPMLHYIVTMQDITRRVRLEEEQKSARLHLYRSARLASIGTLASGVAHEINNPLTAILGFASALLDRTRRGNHIPATELEEYLQIITSETIRCRDIIQSLSAFAQESDMRIHPVSLLESVSAAIKLMQARANKKNIRIVNAAMQDFPVSADTNKLTQVLVNLVANSLDFSPEGSTVTISAAFSAGARHQVRLEVVDSGCGIPQAILPKVFDPFFTTKEVGMGTGLGLAICYKIVEEFNGSIDIISEVGRGTTVRVDFPLAQDGGGEKREA